MVGNEDRSAIEKHERQEKLESPEAEWSRFRVVSSAKWPSTPLKCNRTHEDHRPNLYRQEGSRIPDPLHSIARLDAILPHVDQHGDQDNSGQPLEFAPSTRQLGSRCHVPGRASRRYLGSHIVPSPTAVRISQLGKVKLLRRSGQHRIREMSARHSKSLA